jgi:hypothetical protein
MLYRVEVGRPERIPQHVEKILREIAVAPLDPEPSFIIITGCRCYCAKCESANHDLCPQGCHRG